MGKKGGPLGFIRSGGPQVGRIKTLDKSYREVLTLLDDLLSPTDGVSGNNKLTSYLDKARSSAMKSDPLLASYYDNVSSGLDTDAYGLPKDFSKSLTDKVRAAQSARGTLDWDTSSIEEAAALMGGSEQIRNTRIAQANQLLTSGVLPSMRDFLPDANSLLQAQLGLEGLKLQRGLGRANLFIERQNSIASNTQKYASLYKGGAGDPGGGGRTPP